MDSAAVLQISDNDVTVELDELEERELGLVRNEATSMNDANTSTALIVTNDDEPTLASAPQKAASALPKWETTARERMKAAIKKFSKPLADLVARDANEGDTRLLVTDMLCEGFGFDLRPECLGVK